MIKNTGAWVPARSYTNGITKGKTMPTIKTAVSMEKKLFEKGERLAKRLRMSRSQVYSQALAYLIERDESLELVRKIKDAWQGGLDEDEKSLMEEIKSRRGRRMKDNPW